MNIPDINDDHILAEILAFLGQRSRCDAVGIYSSKAAPAIDDENE